MEPTLTADFLANSVRVNFKETDKISTTKIISYDSFIDTVLRAEKESFIKTPLLPEGTLFYSESQKGIKILTYYNISRPIKFNMTKGAKLSVYVPYLYFYHYRTRNADKVAHNSVDCFVSVVPPSVGTMLYYPRLPNVANSARICFGSNSAFLSDLPDDDLSFISIVDDNFINGLHNFDYITDCSDKINNKIPKNDDEYIKIFTDREYITIGELKDE